MQKPKANENKTSAIIRFFIGLMFLMIPLFFLYYLAAVQDWSFMAKDNVKASVASTPGAVTRDESSPFDTPAATAPSGLIPGVSATPTPTTAAASATATPVPTPTLVVLATPSLEPDATKIPRSELSTYTTRSFNMPETGTDGVIGISRCYCSKPDKYQVMVLEGWGYMDDSLFNGMNSTTYLIVVNESTGKTILYQASNLPRLSGRAHMSLCMNPEAADWRVTLDVSDYADGVYRLVLGLGYRKTGSNKTSYVVYPFDDKYTFTVLGGEAIHTVPETPIE